MEEISVDFKKPLGTPTYRASGFIYGLSEGGTLPEQNLQSEIKVQFFRVGGAQLGCPNGGFVNGHYAERWKVVKAYYARAKAIGAKLITYAPAYQEIEQRVSSCVQDGWAGEDVLETI